MATTRETASNPGSSRRRYLLAGAVASAGALLVTPVLNAVSPLSFVGGLLVSVLAPGAFGLVALASGVQLYRLGETGRGVGLAIGGLLAALLGVLYGLGAVF